MTSIKKNYIYQVTYQALLIITPLITSPYLSRVLGAERIGEYSYYYSIAYYFSLFILLGINNHGTREIAKAQGKHKDISIVFWSIYFVQLCMGIFVLSAYYFFYIRNIFDSILPKIQVIYLLSAVLDINWFFFGLEKFKITVTRNIIIKILTISAIFMLIKDADDLYLYATIMCLGFLFSQILLWPIAIKQLSEIRIDRYLVLSNIKPLFVLFIPILASGIFKYMDKIMLGIMSAKSELGFYENAEKIVNMPLGCITAVGTVMLPRVSYLMETDRGKQKSREYMEVSIRWSMLAASGIAFGLAAIGPDFAPWFWGDGFEDCGLLIQIMSMSILFFPWSNATRMQYLIPQNKDNIYIKATIYSAIVNFIINYNLITRLGSVGTAIGTVIAELILAFYQTFEIRNEVPIKNCVLHSYICIISGITMFIIVRFFSKHFCAYPKIIILFLQIIIGVIIYMIEIVILEKIINKNNIIYEIISLLKEKI